MLDLTGFPILDVVIGLSFVYFLLSIVISALTEALSGVFQLRWRTLKRGMRELMVSGEIDAKQLAALDRALVALEKKGYRAAFNIANRAQLLTSEERTALEEIEVEDRTKAQTKPKRELERILKGHQLAVWSRFESNPRMRALWKQTGALTRIPLIGQRGPSYIQPRVFALTLLDTLAPPEGDGVEDQDVVKRAKKAVETVENPLLKSWLLDALAEVDPTRESVLASIESSFDAVTNRVSGWYKRYASIWVAVFAVLVAIGLNVDSYAIGTRLWKDEALRSAVAARAGNLTSVACPDQAEGAAGGVRLSLEKAAECVSQVEALGLPIGWGVENRPSFTAEGVFSKAFGLVLTVFALMLGAPFWFDTLNKLARLRTTGTPEGTAKA